ncbi:MAG: type III pantothenate kinase [Burkholderiales bacterium]
MKLLLIDAGNTRIKWGVHESGAWLAQGAVPTAEAERIADPLREAGNVDRVIIANVAGAQVAGRLRDGLRMEPMWVSAAREQCGVRSGYADPEQLGADRWAALIGARHLVGGPCVVVNVGTTMTVDALTAESIFLGGFIVAGFELMRDALARNTAQLKVQEGRLAFFPDNTGDAIVSGATNALAGAIDRMVRYMRQTGEDEPAILVSGGDAQRVVACLNGKPRVVDNLVLEGLARIGMSNG